MSRYGTRIWACAPLLLALAGCAPGAVAQNLLGTPELPDGGQAKCKVSRSHDKPLVVEWPSADRAELEAKAQSGIAVVRYDGCEMRLLSQCEVQGAYAYTPVTPKTDTVVIDNEDDLWASLPLGAASLEGKLATAGRLELISTTVGRFAASRNQVTVDDLSGRCEGATHVVTGLVVGAFEFSSGAEADVGGGANVLGAGAGARSRASRETLSKDGDLEACAGHTEAAASAADQALPPRKCAALLRIEVTPVIADQGEVARVRNGKACDAGNWAACDALGVQLLHGRGGPKDEARARALFERACAEGTAVACGNLGDVYLNGWGVPKDLAKTNESWARACDLGWLRACDALAMHQRDGIATPENPARALELFAKACDGGLGVACGNLGDMYNRGTGVPADLAQAAAHWERGCRAGWGGACNAAGGRYREGTGVSRDQARAATLFARGCDLGHGESCGNHGDVLKAGEGVAKNVASAVDAYVRGCEDNWYPACNAAGWHLWQGDGVPADATRAATLLTKACDGRLGIACANLGDLVHPSDPSRARELYRQGCSLGWENACKAAGQ